MLNNSAHPNESTINPGTTLEAIKIKKALITSVNNPSVIMLIGSVKRIIIGFKKALITPNTIARKIAVKKSLR